MFCGIVINFVLQSIVEILVSRAESCCTNESSELSVLKILHIVWRRGTSMGVKDLMQVYKKRNCGVMGSEKRRTLFHKGHILNFSYTLNKEGCHL